MMAWGGGIGSQVILRMGGGTGGVQQVWDWRIWGAYLGVHTVMTAVGWVSPKVGFSFYI